MSRGGPLGRAAAWIAPVAFAVVLVGSVRARLYETYRHVGEATDVYELPAPDKVVLLSLGYRAALADLIWSHVMVSQGLHMEQKLHYDNVIGLLRTIVALEPTYREPYLFAETLITFQSGKASAQDAREARSILEAGARARPLDGEIWLALGEFVAYVAPGSYLDDPAEQAAWRLDGARYLARAGEIGGDNATWQALGGAAILSRAGERDAAVRFLERALAVTDDPALQQSLRAHLAKLKSEGDEEAFRRFDDLLLGLRHTSLPFVSRTQFVLLGPPRDGAACAGPQHASDERCLGTWRERQERLEATADHGRDPSPVQGP